MTHPCEKLDEILFESFAPKVAVGLPAEGHDVGGREVVKRDELEPLIPDSDFRLGFPPSHRGEGRFFRMIMPGRKKHTSDANQQEHHRAQVSDERSPRRTFDALCTHQYWVLAAHFARGFISETCAQLQQLLALRFKLRTYGVLIHEIKEIP